MIKPNAQLKFKTALGAETNVECHVKISGTICVWFDGENKMFMPSFSSIKKCDWFKDLEKNHGKLVGLFHKDKVVIPGEEEEAQRPDW
jgi:hypothetical protein